jgi:hypothetical protein
LYLYDIPILTRIHREIVKRELEMKRRAKTIDVFYAIIWGAVLMGIIYVYQRIKEAAKRKIFNRTEYEEGQKYISEPLNVETSVSVSDMMQLLSDHVSKENFTRYVSSRIWYQFN